MNLDDAILTILERCGDYRVGRTALQKLLYFASELKVVKTGFKPHYYGPFSEKVAAELSDLSSLGFIEERIAAFSSGNTGYVYRITSDGKDVIEGDEEEKEKLWEITDTAIRCFSLAQGLLATAAKVNYVLKTNGKPMTHKAIRSEASELGWEVSPGDIEKVMDFLSKLDLIETVE